MLLATQWLKHGLVRSSLSPPAGAAPTDPTERGVAGRREFVGLIAGCIGLTALGIDAVLPAFAEMRSDFGLPPGSTQIAWVLTAYFLGLAFGQLFYGPLSDRFGRKPLLYVGFGLYMVGAIGSALAPSLAVLIVGRVVWGLGAAGPRSLAIAMVRDRFEGDQMARTMSFAMTIFIMVPVVAPSLGALVLRVAPWPGVFWLTVVVAAMLVLWSIRLPETLPASRRRAGGLGELAKAARTVIHTRATVAYGLAAGCLFGSMAAYLGNSELVIDEVFHHKAQFPLIFGGLALFMGLATLLNARLVVAIGVALVLRRVSLALMVASLGFVVLALATGGRPPFWAYCVAMAILLPLHTTLLPNCNTAAMTPVGKVAGTAAAIIGTGTTAGGAILGSLVDRFYDGTIRPFAVAVLVFAVFTGALIRAADPGGAAAKLRALAAQPAKLTL